MNEELQVLVDFAEGRLEAREFEAMMYKNPRFEDVLDDDPHLAPGTAVGASVYLFVLGQSFGLPGGVLNVYAAVCDWLRRNGHSFQAIKNIPLPLDLQDHEFGLALHRELSTRFCPNGRPPEWLQHPEWPINENGPLAFVGQMLTNQDAHDETVFIFQDQVTGWIQTVLQST